MFLRSPGSGIQRPVRGGSESFYRNCGSWFLQRTGGAGGERSAYRPYRLELAAFLGIGGGPGSFHRRCGGWFLQRTGGAGREIPRSGCSVWSWLLSSALWVARDPSPGSVAADFLKEREEREARDRRPGHIVWSWLLSSAPWVVRDPSTGAAGAGFLREREEQEERSPYGPYRLDPAAFLDPGECCHPIGIYHPSGICRLVGICHPPEACHLCGT